MIHFKLAFALAIAVTPRIIYIPPRPEPTPIIINEDGALDALPPMRPQADEIIREVAMFGHQL